MAIKNNTKMLPVAFDAKKETEQKKEDVQSLSLEGLLARRAEVEAAKEAEKEANKLSLEGLLARRTEKEAAEKKVGAELERSGLASVGLDASKVKRSASSKEMEGAKALDVTPSFVKNSGENTKSAAYKDSHGTTHLAEGSAPVAFDSSAAREVLKNEKLREKVSHSSNPLAYVSGKLLSGIENARAGTQEALESLVEGIYNAGDIENLKSLPARIKNSDTPILEELARPFTEAALTNAQESDNALTKSEEYNAAISEKYKDVETNAVGKVVGDAAYNIGRMLPNILTGSALGKAAGVVAKSAEGASRLAKAASAIIMSGIYGNESVKAAKDEGASDEDAIAYGILNGVIQGAGEQALGGIMGTGGSWVATTKLAKTLGKHLTNPVLRAVGRYGAGVAEEALEEIVQDTLDTLAQKATYNEDAEIDAAQLAYSGFMGGLLGGIGALPASITGTVAAARQMKIVSDAASSVKDITSEEDAVLVDSMIGTLEESVAYLRAGEKYIADENKKAQFIDLADYTEREIGKIKTAVEGKRAELTAKNADAEAGNGAAGEIVEKIEEAAEAVVESGADRTEAEKSLDRLAEGVKNTDKLTDTQKGAVHEFVEVTKAVLTKSTATENAASSPEVSPEVTSEVTPEVTPEVMAEREARAAKATNEIERSGILSGADDKQIKEVMGIADVFRQHGSTLKVRFSADYDVINGTPNGKYDKATNTIYVNPKAKNPFAQVIAHELVHRMANNSSELYTGFLDAVTAYYSSKGINFDQLAKQKANEYAIYNIALDEKQSREEVAAEFVEKYIHDRQAIRSLVRKHRSVAEWFRLRLRGLLGWLKPQQTKEARYLQAALDIFSEELRGVDSTGMTPKQRELKAIDDRYASGEITGEEHDRLAQEVEGKYGESYSITKANGNDVVWLDENILKDKPVDVKYTDYIKNVLATSLDDDGTYLNSLPESGAEVYAHRDLPEEFTGSVYTKFLRNKKQDRFRAKMRTATSLGELVQIATGRSWEKAIHSGNKDAKYGIYKYKSRFAFPESDSSGKTSGVRAYMCDLVIINASDGKKYLYDIQNIKEDTITAGVLFSRINRRDSFKSETQTVQPKGIFNNSISQGGTESNNANESVTEKSQSEIDRSINESGEITGEEHDRLTQEVEGKYDESYSISGDEKYDYTKPFEEQLKDYQNGKIPKYDSLIVGRTPEIYKNIGFNSLPITINQTHVDYALNGTKDAEHKLGYNLLSQLPDALQKPIAVIVSKNNNGTRVVALLKIRVGSSNVVAPVEIDGQARTNNIRIDSNAIVSIYGKHSAANLLNNAIDQEMNGDIGVYYINKKEAASFLQRAGLQLPSGLNIRDNGFVHSIREDGSPVKPIIENVTQSKQFKRWFGDWQNDPASASKVVNADGTPKVVYHGTNAEFNEFDSSKNKNITLGNGHYFGENKSVVEKMYGSGMSGRVIASYLNIKNPFVVRSTEFDDIDSMPFIVGERTGEKNVTKESIQSVLKANGYDGVRFITPTEGNDIWVAFEPTQIKSATDNVGTFSAANPDIRYSISPAVDENGKQKIAAGMSDERRYEILKDKSIRVYSYDKNKYEAARPRIKDINVIRFNDAKNIVRILANEFGAIRVYENDDVELEFEFTNNGLAESLHKQKRNLDDYVKFLTIAEHVIENAKGLECHTDRYSGTPRADITNAGDFILIGAFEDEDGIVPVKLLVKQFTDKPNKLYVAITVNKIEAEIVTLAKGKTAKHHPAPSAPTSESEIVTLAKGKTAKHHPAPSDSEYSLAQILRNVNPDDKTLLKYIPDGFLDDAQLAAKEEAIKEEREYVEKKTGVSYSINFDGATPVRETAPIEVEPEQETLALDEEDAKVAVPYEDEDGNLRFTSLTGLTPEEESLYESMPLMGAAFDAQDVKVIAEENEKLKRSVEYLKGQFKATEGYIPKEQAVRRLIRQLALDYSAKEIDVNRLADRVITVAKEMNSGRIDAREAYDRYVQIAREIIEAQEVQTNPLYEEYAELRNYLRSTGINLNDQYRSDFEEYGGWNEFRKSVMGIMKLSNEGIGVDVAYDEITGIFPGLLDESVINPADQMKELARLANSLRAVYENTFTDEIAEQEAESLGAVIGSQISGLPEAKTYADRMKDARYKAAQDVRDAYRAQMERMNQRTNERLEALETSFREKDAARKLRKELAEKRRQEERIRRDRSRGKYVSLDKIEEAMADGTFAPKMIAVHKKLKEYRNAVHVSQQAGNATDIAKYTELAENTAKYIEAVGRRYRQLRDNDSREALGNFHEWEGKEGFLVGLRYATETPTRIIEDIAPNEEAAKRMLAYAFDPVRKNEANRQRWIRDLRERVKALKIGTKKEGKNANTESEAVQLVGEYNHIIDLLGGKRRMYGMDKGEWQKALDDFKAANPDMDWAAVESKAKAMREIYDEIYDELSNVLVTNGYPPVNKRGGYFPHFSENEPDSVLGKAASVIGLQIQGNELPTSIYGMTASFKPGKSYFGNLNRRTGNNTTYDALRGFEIYINGASNVIHHTDDIQRLRSLARVIRQESADPDTKKKIEELVNARDGLTEEQKDLQINELLSDAKFRLAGFVSWLDEYTNGLANKKSKYDRSMEELLGRTIYSLASQLEGRVAANMVALNPGSWLTNFIPLTQARALIGDKYMLKAAAMAVANAARDDGFTDMSDFLVSRKGSDPVVMAMSDRVSSFMSRPMEWIDGFASQTIVRARYMQNVEEHKMSKEAAMAEANVFAGKVMADRSKGATPTIFNSKNPLIKAFTQFQIEQNNQLRYLIKDIPKETEKAQRAILALMSAMMKFAVGAYLFNDLYEYFIGRRPAFDILGIVNNTIGSAVGYKLPNILDAIAEVTGDVVKGEMKTPGEYLETQKKGITPALGEGGIELLESLPFVGGILGGGRLPIGNAIGNPFEVAGEALALIPTVDEETGEIVQNGSVKRLLKTAYDELSKPVYYLAPKFGGGQAKKVLEGTFAVLQKGSYTYNKKGEAQLQYPVLGDKWWETALNWAGAVVFGKTTTPWAREWIENSFKTRTVGETAAYKAMLEIGEQSRDAYAILDTIKEAKAEHTAQSKKGNSPYSSGTDAALAALKADDTLQEISKAQVYKHLLASSDEKEYLYGTIRYQDPSLYRVLTGMRGVTADGEVSAKAKKQELILNSDLSDAAKVKVYRVKAASDEDEDFMDDMKRQGVSEITTLKVITKAGTATKNSEKYKAVSTTSMTEVQRNAFMKQIMTESQYSKYNLANSKGITTAVWAQFTARLEAVNESGAASQQEAAKALAGMNITQNQKAAIWQLQNKGWSAESNPFNPKVGALIKAQME